MRWDEVAKRMPIDRDITGAELGVWRGRMSQHLFCLLPKLTLWMIDRWNAVPIGHSYLESGSNIAVETQENFNRAYDSANNLTAFAAKRRLLLRLDIDDVVEDMADDKFDFVFIDADHTYEAVKKDIDNWWPKVKSGGWLCGHDYEHEEAKGWGVKRAVDEFAEANQMEIEIGDDHTWFIWKAEE